MLGVPGGTYDGEFNSEDFVAVFKAGEYEDGIPMNSGWAEGDWNGDGDFDSGDFVAAFTDGGYEQGLRVDVKAVPEPTSVLSLLAAFVAIHRCHVRSGRDRPVSSSEGREKGKMHDVSF